jgi:branched-chain amino acid transport system substrate-binding protein
MKLSQTVAQLLFGTALTLATALSAPAQAEDINIGFIAPMTGGFAQVGKDMVDGFQLYLDEVNGDFSGAKVKLIVEDDQAKPDMGVTKARKLVLQDKVQMFVGGVLASTGYALAPVSTSEKTVYIASIPAADDLTQRISVFLPHRLVELAAASCLGGMGLRPGLQESRHGRRRLCLRL